MKTMLSNALSNALSSVVLASLLTVTACGGDRNLPTPTPNERGALSLPAPAVVDARVVDNPIAMRVAETPLPIIEPLVMPTTYAAAVALGKSLAASGDPRAKELFELAVKLDKTQAAPHVELARLAITSNARATAIKEATKAVKLAPTWSHAHNTLGRAELLRHSYSAAITAFATATELEPDNAWAWNNLGYTQLQLAKYEDALASLQQATAKPSATGYMFNNLGTAYEHLDQLDDARDAFDKGDELGSAAAAASRKRLEGVDSIIVMRSEPAVGVKEYELREEMPEPMVAQDDREAMDRAVSPRHVEAPSAGQLPADAPSALH